MNLFTDPVVAAPMWGCLLMGVASALVGVLIYVRRRSLVGETLSHAAYPGIVLSALLMSSPWAALLGASLSGLLGLYFVQVLERRFRVSSDTALCFVLSTFLGVGVLLASRMQFTEPVAFQKVQALLYGQAATMLIVHVYGYALLTLAIVLFILIFRRALQVVNFDRDFSKVCGLSVTVIDGLTMGVIVLATVMGIRSVGVVLMAGMLIAPAVAARPFVNSFGKMLSVSVLMGFVLLKKEYVVTSFDGPFAKMVGISPVVMQYVMVVQTSITLVGAFRAVGVVLVLALLVVPPVTARLFVHRVWPMIGVSAGISSGAALIAVALSRHMVTVYDIALSTSGLMVVLLLIGWIGSAIAVKGWRR